MIGLSIPGAFGASRLTFIEAIFLLLGRNLSFGGFFLYFYEKNQLNLHIFVLSSINSCLRVFGQLFVFDFRVSKLVEGCL